MEAQTRTNLQTVRKARGLAAAELAQRVGVSRQTIYAIEDGSYVPNTVVALRLARVLDTRVEDLFALQEPPADDEGSVHAELLTATASSVSEGQFVRLCRVGEHVVAVPAISSTSAYLPSADSIVQRRVRNTVRVKPFEKVHGDVKRLVLAGCDPALSILSELLAPSGIDLVSVPASSRNALQWLKQGHVHVAGSHLRDHISGEYNVPFVQRAFPEGSVRIVTFAVWEEGLVVQRGNPKAIAAIADLPRKDLKIVNREKGSGSRDLLDEGLRSTGIDTGQVRGYEEIASGHLQAAQSVASGSADCCVATRSASRCFGLDFVPLTTERFDLTISQESLELPGIKLLLEILNHIALRRKLQVMAGYETQQTGSIRL